MADDSNPLGAESEARRTARARLGLSLLVAAIAAGLALRQHFALEPRTLLDGLRSVQGHWWSIPAYWGAYLVGTSLFVPAVAFHLAAGATFGFGVASIANLAAVNGAASLHFFVARALGRERVSDFLSRHGFSALEARFQKGAVGAMVAIRFLPLPFAGVNAAAGVSGMRWRDFALGSFIGSLPVTLVYTHLAASLVDGVAGARDRALVHVAVAAALILAVTFGPRYVLARLRRRRGAGPVTLSASASEQPPSEADRVAAVQAESARGPTTPT